MNLEEMKAIALPIIQAGFESGLDSDDVKMQMMQAKVPWSKLNTIYKTVAIDNGLMADPKTVTDELNSKIETVDWEQVQEWEVLADYAEKLAESVEGATAARAVTLARAYCKNELDLALPRKPKAASTGGSGRVGKIAQAVVDLYQSNSNPTKEEFYAAIDPAVGGDNKEYNLGYYLGLHMAVCSAIAQARPLADIAAELAQQSKPAYVAAEVVEDDEEEEMAA